MKNILLYLVSISIILPLNFLYTQGQPPPLKAEIISPEKFALTSTPGHVEFRGSARGGTPPYSYLWTMNGGIFPEMKVKDPGLILIKKGIHTIMLQVTDKNGDTASDSVEVCVEIRNPHTRIYSPLPGALTNDPSNYPVKGYINVQEDEGLNFLKRHGVSLADVPFQITIQITLEEKGKKTVYFSWIKELSDKDKENNFFDINIGKNLNIGKGRELSMLIEPVGIDPAGNGILVMMGRALMTGVNTKELLDLVNDSRLRGYRETHDIFAYLMYKHTEQAFSFFLDNFSKLTVCGKANLIRALRITDKQEILKFLVLFLDDRTEVPYTRWDGKTPAERMRICDYAFNSTSFLLKFRAISPTRVPERIYPDIPVEIRDKYVAAIKNSWIAGREKFLKIKKPLSTEKINFNEKLEKFKTDLKTINKDIQKDTGDLLDTPDKLMDKMLQLSLAKKYEEMRKHIYDFQTDEVKDYVDFLINEVKKADPKKKGDFSYSDKAMKNLTTKFRNRFKKVEPYKLRPFRKDDKRLVKVPDDKFKVFKEGRVFILVIKVGQEYKLIFWEGLNKLANISSWGVR